jgi:hypothetical protein
MKPAQARPATNISHLRFGWTKSRVVMASFRLLMRRRVVRSSHEPDWSYGRLLRHAFLVTLLAVPWVWFGLGKTGAAFS